VLPPTHAQDQHRQLLQQVQELETLRRENAEMAALVAQLAVLRREQGQLTSLCDQVEALKADNSMLHRKSLRLPMLQEEQKRLQVSDRGRLWQGWIQLASRGWRWGRACRLVVTS
jgi:hypothetical protein